MECRVVRNPEILDANGWMPIIIYYYISFLVLLQDEKAKDPTVSKTQEHLSSLLVWTFIHKNIKEIPHGTPQGQNIVKLIQVWRNGETNLNLAINIWAFASNRRQRGTKLTPRKDHQHPPPFRGGLNWTSTLTGFKNLPRNIAHLGFTVLYSKLAKYQPWNRTEIFIKSRAAMILWFHQYLVLVAVSANMLRTQAGEPTYLSQPSLLWPITQLSVTKG